MCLLLLVYNYVASLKIEPVNIRKRNEVLNGFLNKEQNERIQTEHKQLVIFYLISIVFPLKNMKFSIQIQPQWIRKIYISYLYSNVCLFFNSSFKFFGVGNLPKMVQLNWSGSVKRDKNLQKNIKSWNGY